MAPFNKKLKMNWAIELKIAENQTIESRLRAIIAYLIEKYEHINCLLDDIDATGSKGNQLTKIINAQGRNLVISKDDLQSLVFEDGQIFELDLHLKNSSEFRFIVRDGNVVIVVGTGDQLTYTAS